jgi:4-diphosphocytidyl-2-C-methyl-D-erythritol kinase
LPSIFAVLVNPRIQAPTPKVFAAFDLTSKSNAGQSSLSSSAAGFGTAPVLDFGSLGGNDLETAAIWVVPIIAAVLKRLSQIPEARVTGMSGSGATCFALFSDRRSAAVARRSVAADHPEWWVEATDLH